MSDEKCPLCGVKMVEHILTGERDEKCFHWIGGSACELKQRDNEIEQLRAENRDLQAQIKRMQTEQEGWDEWTGWGRVPRPATEEDAGAKPEGSSNAE